MSRIQRALDDGLIRLVGDWGDDPPDRLLEVYEEALTEYNHLRHVLISLYNAVDEERHGGNGENTVARAMEKAERFLNE